MHLPNPLVLLFAALPAICALDCSKCGGNLFKNNAEISTGYLLQIAAQIDVYPCGVKDLYKTIVEKGGGMCIKFPGEIEVPAPA